MDVYVSVGVSGLGEHTFEMSSEPCRGVLPVRMEAALPSFLPA